MNTNNTTVTAVKNAVTMEIANVLTELDSRVKESLGSLFTKEDVSNALSLLHRNFLAAVDKIDVQVEEPQAQSNILITKELLHEAGLVLITEDQLLDLVRDNVRDAVNECEIDSDTLEIKGTEYSIDYGNRLHLEQWEVESCDMSSIADAAVEDLHRIDFSIHNHDNLEELKALAESSNTVTQEEPAQANEVTSELN
jgi:hypothetical protein